MLKPRTPRRTAETAPLLPAQAEAGAPDARNDPEITVSALSGALKKTVEERFGYVRVRGEVSNYRGPHSSGHAYFCLKDEGARIDAVIWKTAFARMRIKPEEGLEVVASGRITTFPGKSSYQIVIETLEPAGLGALMAAMEERRRRFAAEGLFDHDRKRPLPFLPGVIGVVTSPTGAVIRDILHRIAGRFPRHVLVWPARVQGEGSAAEVARAIAGLNALMDGAGIPAPHVIIVARGGGSLEDLWGFNEEIVVRAAAASRIPLISAVGHETDWTLIDHVADLRAPTPTGAAELAVPVLLDLSLTVDRLKDRQTVAMLRLLDGRRSAFAALARVLPSGEALLSGPRQRLDGAATRLPGGLRSAVDARRLALARLGGRLAAQAPQARLARMAQGIEALSHRLRRAETVLRAEKARRLGGTADRFAAAFASRLRLARETAGTRRTRLEGLDRRLTLALRGDRERRAARLAALGQVLAGLGYRSVLARGFALVRDEAGAPVRTAAGLLPRAVLALEFADGVVRAEVSGPDEPASSPDAARPKPRKGQPKSGQQGSLF